MRSLEDSTPESLRLTIVKMAKWLVIGLLVCVFLFWSGNEVAGAIFGVCILIAGGMIGKTWYDIRGLSSEDESDDERIQ